MKITKIFSLILVKECITYNFNVNEINKKMCIYLLILSF